jgi:quercetin dioxygenase-like cupin family protein
VGRRAEGSRTVFGLPVPSPCRMCLYDSGWSGMLRSVASSLTFNGPRLMRSFPVASLLAALACAACAPSPPSASLPVPAAPVRLSNTADAAVPPPGTLTRTTVHESERTVTQVLRLAPGAEIAEHHHPFFDESFIVERGNLRVRLNDQVHELSAGAVVFIPAGTVIAGQNTGSEEARVVVVFSNIGRPGPLTIPGHPQH